MKRCGYCGKHEQDNSLACGGCGTPFPVVDPIQSGVGGGRLRSPLGLSAATALGILLVSGALFFAVGRAAVEVGLLPGKPPAPYRSIYSFLTSTRPGPFIVFGAILPTFWLCQARCHGRFRAFATAGLIVLALAVLALLPRLLPGAASFWCVPAVMFGNGGSSSAGCYVGAALQSAAGVWLLVWPHPRRNMHEELSA